MSQPNQNTDELARLKKLYQWINVNQSERPIPSQSKLNELLSKYCKSKSGMRLHLGCGQHYLNHWMNLDCVKSVKADTYHDLNVIPWPFKDDSVMQIEMDAVLEHLKDTMASLAEIHRILLPGGIAHIHVPYACSVWAFQDPTHVRYFTERTLDYVKDGFDYNFYTGIRFEILKAELTSGSNSLTAKIRNLIPFRKVLRWFLWNMYDGVDYVIRKPI